MALHECPGPERKKPDMPEERPCPDCGAEIEIWSRETKATCSACGGQFTRDQLEQNHGSGQGADGKATS